MSDSYISDLINLLPEDLVKSIVFCSAPHWFDVNLGKAIIEEFLGSNGRTSKTFFDLINLPFVYSHLDNTWQYTKDAREFFRSKLFQRKNDYVALSNFIVSYLDKGIEKVKEFSDQRQSNDIFDKDEWVIQRSNWQIAYHLAPIDPCKSIEKMIEMEINQESLDFEKQVINHQLTNQVLEEQKVYLSNYKVDLLYLDGRYDFSIQQFKSAEDKLSSFWKNEKMDNFRKVEAGHILSMIYKRKGQIYWDEKSREILNECLRLSEDMEIEHEPIKSQIAKLLNSLGATLIRLGGSENLILAESLIRKSIKLFQELNINAVDSICTFGNYAIATSKMSYFEEAEKMITNILSSIKNDYESEGLEFTLAKLYIKFFDSKEYYLRSSRMLLKCLDTEIKKNRNLSLASILYWLGILYTKYSDENSYQIAEKYLLRSRKIWHKAKNIIGDLNSNKILLELYQKWEIDDKENQIKNDILILEGKKYI